MAMENPPRSLPLNWTFFPQPQQDHYCKGMGMGMDYEVKQSFLLTMELEETRMKAQEELRARDEQISHLKDLLARALKERDQAQDTCRNLMLHKFISSDLDLDLPRKEFDSITNNNNKNINIHNNNINNNNNGFSASSDCDESIVSSPRIAPETTAELPPLPDAAVLPEKGKLLEAVIKAGPLLQTLLLAGPLPQWRHPPPPLDTNQIPPFPSPAAGRKRGASSSDGEQQLDSPSVKCQRLILLH
ncbi:uncharacterized protein LOC127260178 [Andrographis paniculata]|uniref:uncharacterized protein LOC127260178 n=1 Tax=Andrographis paniculata TaxID=175694 RepID=UPI0021E9A3E0|nr:uncharacterized protein LOC127260178 [Andrographis paniculata]